MLNKLFQYRLGFACILVVTQLSAGCVTLTSNNSRQDKRSLLLSSADEAKIAFFSGQLADLSGDFQKAIQFYYQALLHDSESLTIRRYLISDLIRLDRFHEARQEYNVIIESDNNDSQSRYMLGQLFEAVGDTRVAEALYRDAIKISEENSGPFTKLGLMLLKQDQPKTACDFLEKALHINPQDREARRILVKYFSINQPKAAELLLQAALKEAPDDVEWLSLLAKHYTDENQKDKAAAVYQQISEFQFDAIEAHRFLSIYYLKKNDWEGAIFQLEKILRTHPDDQLARRNLGLAFYKLGNYEEAKQHLEELLRMNQGDALTHYLMGSIYRQSDRTHLAIEQFSEAKKLDADMVEIHLGLAGALMKINELERAENVLQEACIRFPKTTSLWINYGLVLMRQNNPKKAVDALLHAQQLSPKDASIYFHMGRAYHDLGLFEEAVAVWKRALQLDPAFADVYNHLGYVYAEKGRELKNAVRWIKKALALHPGNGYYLDSLGWAYFKQGQYQLALQQLLASRDIFLAMNQPVDPVIYDHLGDVYYQLKKYQEAGKVWQQILELQPDNQLIQEKLQRLKKQQNNGVEDENVHHRSTCENQFVA